MKHLKLFILLSLSTSSIIRSSPDKAFIKHKNITINNINLNLNGIDFANIIASLVDTTKQKSAHWLNSNKKLLVGFTLTSIYAYIANKIVYGKIVLRSNTNWANWKNDANLGDLLSRSSNQVCRELHQSILDKYNNNNQIELLAPLVLFNNHLEQELLTLRSFCQIGKTLKKIKIKFLFFITDHELELATEKINRLLYLKKLVTESIQVSLNN